MTGSLPRMTIELRYTNKGWPRAGCTWWITKVSGAICVGGTSRVGTTGANVVIGLLPSPRDTPCSTPHRTWSRVKLRLSALVPPTGTDLGATGRAHHR